MSAGFWTPERIERLRVLHYINGLTFARCAKALACSRNSAISADRRHIKGIPDDRSHHGSYRRRPRTAGMRAPGGWSDAVLTETWAERKARRAAERASL